MPKIISINLIGKEKLISTHETMDEAVDKSFELNAEKTDPDLIYSVMDDEE